jgi:hypothetical protein
MILNKINWKWGFNESSEIINGRFSMIGFLSLLIIEFILKQSFLSWINLNI